LTSHDQLVKELLRAFFADFLLLVLPGVAKRLRLGKQDFLDKELFTDWPRGKRREADLLARVPVRGTKESPILVHIEIEAKSRAGMDLRMWGYYMQILLRHRLPVLPIVLILQGGPPGVRRETRKEVCATLRVAGFRYHAFGLSRCQAEDYLERPQSLAWALAALMRPGRRTRAELKMACLRRIAAADLAGNQSFLLVNFVETYLQLTGRQAEEFDRLRQNTENQEVVAVRMTWAEQIEAEGLRKGREAAREEAQAEALQAVRSVVLLQLEQRFGAVPQEARQKLERISTLEPLTHLAGKVVVASSLAELGL
jgi:hypothetical protein